MTDEQRFFLSIYSDSVVFQEDLKGDEFLISPLMKQADIPHASQNIKIWTQNNANMNIISSLNNILLVKGKKRQKSQMFEVGLLFCC